MTAPEGGGGSSNRLLLELLRGLIEANDKKSLQKYLPGAQKPAGDVPADAEEASELPAEDLAELEGLQPSEGEEADACSECGGAGCPACEADKKEA